MRDEKQIQLVAAGDENALRSLVEQYYPEIMRYCQWHAPNTSYAEDAAQESFLKAIHYVRRNSFRGNFRAFLYQIARNTCLDMKKSSWNSLTYIEDIKNEPLESSDAMEQFERREVIHSALLTLTEEERELIHLRFDSNLKLREIAAILNLPVRTVQSRLRKALKELEPHLKEV